MLESPKTYVADHNTEPPEGQEICTDPENILIRQLLQKRDKAIGKGKQDKGKAADKGKRPAEAPHDRAGEGPSGQASTLQTFTADQLRSKTNQDLGEILKGRSLNSRGKKEELVQRILDAQHRAKKPARP
ncbi:hypothetical protein WJX75_009505 [Coccomyxa subellipsoidea]|uniref:DET1- and DDB1-associated protein 1 domain-containing protein n=1 Tax=Coccomyxa subellipsoidea TaxID=248742 RepID=A0ABR2Z072_9CHLO